MVMVMMMVAVVMMTVAMLKWRAMPQVTSCPLHEAL